MLCKQSALSVLHFVGSKVPMPLGVAEVERHVVGHLLHVRGSAWPRRGHFEFVAVWGGQHPSRSRRRFPWRPA